MAEPTPKPPKPAKGKNVYAKIANIQQSIHVVIKGGTNTHFNYSFARERDVIAEVKPLLGKEGLAITHSVLEESRDGDLTKLKIRFRVTNVDDKDDFVESDAIGYGKDTQDKGAPKAYTMALKYFLSKQFLVETGDDAEEEGKKRDAKPPKEDPKVVFEKAIKMVGESRNKDGLLEYAFKLKDSKTFNAAQKKELNDAIKNRIEELGN